MKDWLKTFSEWNKQSLGKHLFPNYVFNKWVYWGCFAVMVLLFLFICNDNKWDFSTKFYFHCPENSGGCDNPYYISTGEFYSGDYKKYVEYPCPIEDYTFCGQESFIAGYTYGTPPNKHITNFTWYVLVIWIIGFIINHFAFNNKKRLPK